MKSKKRVALVIGLVLIACIVTFITIIGLKEYSEYKKYSEIEEIHVNEPIENPDDYGLAYDDIMFCCYSYSFDVEYYYWLFFFSDGSVVTGKGNRDQLSVLFDAVRYKDKKLFWSSLNYTYEGNIGGKQLYKLINLEDRINYEAEYFSTMEAYEEIEKKMAEIDYPEPREHWEWYTKSPYLKFWKLQEEGGSNPFWEEEADGITYYLYDENAEEVVYSTIDNSFFDEWMSESWGNDWKDTFPIYRSKDDFVVPKTVL